ncbi:MAG: N-acetyltransferase [Parasporobacterium sp.]|nr:N-acetyltransferase [Parasporobacterium sp.]
MNIYNAVPEDLPEIEKIYETAREYMRNSGNPNQWGTTNPPVEFLINDINKEQLYVIRDNKYSPILGCFSCIEGKDPTYSYIEDGSWINDDPYVTLHRVASAGIRKGILDFILAKVSEKHPNIRIDTHEDNKTMQHILIKNGFSRRGIIYLANGKPRLAFQRINNI